MPEPLEFEGGIKYEFNPKAVFETGGKSFEFISFKKITTYKEKAGKEQDKYQNLTVKPAHKEEFIPWLEECVEELKNPVNRGDDVPF